MTDRHSLSRKGPVPLVPMVWRIVVPACLSAWACSAADGFINPNFTPVHLCKQADAILVVRFSPADAEGHAVARIEKALKGSAAQEAMEFDFSAGAFEAKGKKIAQMVSGPQAWGLLFVGSFEMDTDLPPAGEDRVLAKALLHVGKDWVTLSSFQKGAWDMDDIDARLLGTWSGSSEMLRRAVEYILSDEDATVPVTAEAEWSAKVALGKAAGAVGAALPIDIDGSGQTCVFIASDQGDQIIRYLPAEKKAENVAPRRGLASTSLQAAWCDVDRDGKMDLASWDGRSLRLYLQQDGGSFAESPVAMEGKLEGEVVSLAAIDCGRKGMGLLAGTKGGLVVVVVSDKLAAVAQPLPVPGELAKDLGQAGVCLVADFDGDSLCDVIQIGRSVSLLHRGKPGGGFAAPVKIEVACGKGRCGAAAGDYDMDGLLDIFTCSADGNCLWHNTGGGKFSEMLAMSGEIEYIAKRDAISPLVGDVNNDGRQDIAILYGKTAPQVFFNRGFNSFGHARTLDVVETDVLAAAGDGQQAGCLADLNGDGALDFVLVLGNGEIWMLPRKVGPDGALAAAPALAPGKGCAGPLTVVGWQEKRCFGAYSIQAGQAGVLFGLREPGPVSLRWTIPGGKKQGEDVFLDKGQTRVVLNK